MAGRPRCFLPLFGMGLRHFSMSPALVPPIKEMARHTPLPQARRIARNVLRLKTSRRVRNYLTRQARQICPNVALLDTRN